MSAYYNEFDKSAAAWLRELIKRNLIAPGDVDERSIKDVRPEDLRGYEQVHMFAGIGGWSLALRLAGVPDDFPVWTGSCPCQPFSAAGKRRGTEDERHLWPEMLRLIAECRPATAFGEQVASKDGREWLARVFTDLEDLGYAAAGADLCAAGVGAPHIRQRLWWVADADCERFPAAPIRELQHEEHHAQPRCGLVGMADSESERRGVEHADDIGSSSREVDAPANAGKGSAGWVADAQDSDRWRTSGAGDGGRWSQEVGGPGDVNFWSRCGYVACRDSKVRRFEPGSFPLATGVSARVVRLRGYGNAINPWVAKEFIQSYFEAKGEMTCLSKTS